VKIIHYSNHSFFFSFDYPQSKDDNDIITRKQQPSSQTGQNPPSSSSLLPGLASFSFSPRFSLMLSVLSALLLSPYSEIWGFSLMRGLSLLYLLLIRHHPFALHLLSCVLKV
jgi:hypothetical protein